MNRMYNQFRLALEKRVVDLYLKVAIGATGAPTINAAASKGIASIARVSAGKYTITLQDKYVDLLQIDASVVLAAGSPGVLGGCVIRTNSVASATPTLVVEFLDGAGSPVEVTNGATVLFQISLKASSV